MGGGKGRRGLRFTTADNAVVASPAAMSGSYAVSFWVNVTSRSGINPRVFQSRVGNDVLINITNNRGVGFVSGTVTVESNPPTFNTWEHYVVNFNATTGQGVVYRNGAPVALGPFTDSANLATWVIGHSSNLASSNDTLNGLLDELRVYGRVLTDEDIAILANQGTPEPTHLEPIHHWKFDETTGFTAVDSAGDADGILLNWNATEPRWVQGRLAVRCSSARRTTRL